MRLALLATIVLAVACHDTTAPKLLPGEYAFVTLDGAALPVSVGTPTGGPWFVRGSLQINGDGTYTQAVTDSIRYPTSTVTGTESESGAWTQRGDSLFFTPSGLPVTPASRSAGEVIRFIHGRHYRFVR